MPFVPVDPIISHWHHLFEEFQSSPQGVYVQVERLLEKRQVPNAAVSRVHWPEAGALSSWREYLRVERLGFRFDICAAPFGSGFFVSWWLVQPLPTWWGIVLWHVASLFIGAASLVLVLATSAGLLKLAGALNALDVMASVFASGLAAVVAVLAVFIAVFGILLSYHLAIRLGFAKVQTIAAILVLGPLYMRVFNPVTYYQLDTALMFRDVVHSAVLEALEAATQAKGLRALTPRERRPEMRRLSRS